ncbi:hypothetical protein ACO1O0_000947 [Amphichorda felina]
MEEQSEIATPDKDVIAPSYNNAMFPRYNGETARDVDTYNKLYVVWNDVKSTLTKNERETFCDLVSMSDTPSHVKSCSQHRINTRARNPRTFNRAHYIILKEMFGLEACARQGWWRTFKRKYPDEAARDEASVPTPVPVSPTRILRSQRRRSVSDSSLSSVPPEILLVTPSPSPQRRTPRPGTSRPSRRSIVIRTHRGGFPAQRGARSSPETPQLQARIQALERERDEKEAQVHALEAELYQMGGRLRELENMVGGLRQFTTGFGQILAQLPV